MGHSFLSYGRPEETGNMWTLFDPASQRVGESETAIFKYALASQGKN
jgi:hypothetical protein